MPPPRRPSAPISPDVLEARRVLEGFERQIILGAANSYFFYQYIKPSVCPYDPATLSHRQDFNTGRYNSLWALIAAFYYRFEHLTLEKDINIPVPVLSNLIADSCNKERIAIDLAEQLTEEVTSEEAFTKSLTYDSSMALAKSPAFQDWLSSRLVEQTVGMIQLHRSVSTLTMGSLEEMVAKAKEAANLGRESCIVTGNSFVRTSRRIYPSVCLDRTFPNLMKVIGGGFFWGDATMVAAVNAGGKTIVLCQMADAFAEMGYKTVVVTTERRPDELFVRAVSNRLSIDIARLTDTSKLQANEEADVYYIPDFVWNDPKLAQRMLEMDAQYGENLRYVDWSQGQGNSIKANFEATIRAIEVTGFIPQVILFDWIGGGLDVGAQKEWMRLYFHEAAELLINHAKRTKRIMIMAAQLDKKLVHHKLPYVDMSMLSECKTMTNNLTNFIGISARRDSDPKVGMSALHPMQQFCVSKATRGTGGPVAVEACFQFQRFAELRKGLSAEK